VHAQEPFLVTVALQRPCTSRRCSLIASTMTRLPGRPIPLIVGVFEMVDPLCGLVMAKPPPSAKAGAPTANPSPTTAAPKPTLVRSFPMGFSLHKAPRGEYMQRNFA
jgi:hypothetical protein